MSSYGRMTLAEIRLAAQQRADMVNSGFVSPQEWASYINQALYELYDLLIEHYSDDYFVASPYNFTTDGLTDKFSLPTDFYKLLGVDILAGNRYLPIKRFNFSERGRTSLNGSVPPSGQTLRLWYAPRLTELVNDSDIADGVDGWLEYVVIVAAMKALVKEESDISALAAEQAGLVQRIESAAGNRDASQPQTVSDSYADYDYHSCYSTMPPYTLKYRLQGNSLWVMNAY